VSAAQEILYTVSKFITDMHASFLNTVTAQS